MEFTYEFTIEKLAKLILEFQDINDLNYKELCDEVEEYLQ